MGPAAPHHVRFSPSAKSQEAHNSHSPFGRKTRSSRRGLSSYIQSLPSEDEQSEFNRHYRSDLRRRQQRRASEEDTKDSQESGEKKSTRSQGRRRMDSETSGVEEMSLATRKSMRRRKEMENEEEEGEGEGDPTVTESSLRRSRRHGTGAAPLGD